MEMKVHTHVVKTTPNEVLCRIRKACYGWKVETATHVLTSL